MERTRIRLASQKHKQKMPRPAQTGVGGPGVRSAAWRVSPWQSARRGQPPGGGGAAIAARDTEEGPTPDAFGSGQSDADDPQPPAVSGGSSADEEPPADITTTLSGQAFLAYYPQGVYPPPTPGVLADPPAGEPAVVGRLDGGADHHTVWAVGSVLPDAATAGLPADCSFSAGDRLLALGLYGLPGRGTHATALLAQASGGDAANLVSPPPDGPRGREARAVLCGAGTAPARGPAPRLRFECETLLVWERISFFKPQPSSGWWGVRAGGRLQGARHGQTDV